MICTQLFQIKHFDNNGSGISLNGLKKSLRLFRKLYIKTNQIPAITFLLLAHTLRLTIFITITFCRLNKNTSLLSNGVTRSLFHFTNHRFNNTFKHLLDKIIYESIDRAQSLSHYDIGLSMLRRDVKCRRHYRLNSTRVKSGRRQIEKS